MKSHRSFLIITALGIAFAAAAPAQTGFPFQDESLRYAVNWPSGLSLGEGTLSAKRTPSGWQFDMSLTAGIPGYSVADKFRGSATGEQLCSTEFERDLSQGARKSRERTTFDQKKGSAHRATVNPEGGGRGDFDIPSCARDALTFFFFARRELGQGRVPQPQQVYYGSAYTMRMDYMGPLTIPVADKPTVTDRVAVSVKGPKSSFNFEAYFARDAARTPLSIKVPLPVGSFSMDLVR
jgi:hypothetical protein